MEKAANAKKNLIVKYEENENNVFTIAFFSEKWTLFLKLKLILHIFKQKFLVHIQ